LAVGAVGLAGSASAGHKGNILAETSVTTRAIDSPQASRYSENNLTIQETYVAVNSIQLGQVWRSDADGQDYLVTKVYSEVFTQYAMLRPAGITAPDAPTVRLKVTKTPQGAALPGYTFTQDGSF
jgi:hypothetical protein